MNQKAQGTIEYLVILAVVMAIGLVVVGVLSGFGDISEIGNSITGIGSKISSGGISVIEAVADEDSGVLVLSNVSGEPITITSVSTGTVTVPYNTVIFKGDSVPFIINSADTSCLCEEGETTKTCTYAVNYTTINGVPKTSNLTTTIDCVEVAQAINGENPFDETAPVVTLSSPTDDYNTASRSVIFSFSTTEAGTCVLKAGSDSNSYTITSSGDNTIEYTFSSDKLTDWNISCTDESNNTGASTSRTLDVDANAYQITTCAELQEMNNNLAGNYELINDVDCSGIAFSPIGGWAGNPFSGSLDGKNKIINNLHIEWSSPTGLFGDTYRVLIRNLGVENAQINCVFATESAAVGGLAGNFIGKIENSYFKGDITGNYVSIGGLVGATGNDFSYGNNTIENSYFEGTITSPNEANDAAGIVGSISYTDINNSYAVGTANGTYNTLGGLTGESFGTSIENSFSTMDFSGATASTAQGGLLGYNVWWYELNEITNSYWDTYLTGQSNCINDSNNGCTSTNNQAASYYGASGIPFSQLGWSTDVWQARDGDYPALKWQN